MAFFNVDSTFLNASVISQTWNFFSLNLLITILHESQVIELYIFLETIFNISVSWQTENICSYIVSVHQKLGLMQTNRIYHTV